MSPIISIAAVSKVYAGGFRALDRIDLGVAPGEIFALLGPNGAGKTTLIGLVCGIVRLDQGTITVAGLDVVRDARKVRSMIGLVPQELTTDAFETVRATVAFSRGLFGCPPDDAHVERTLRALSLWDKRDNKIMTLSGGMKRRVMIAKALSHEPRVLFLDEPTAGVDVALRKDMWAMVRSLRESGVTIVLTTHYIEEAEEMADRVGVIARGRILLVEDKATLMQTLGKKQLTLRLAVPLVALPGALAGRGLVLQDGGREIVYAYDPKTARGQAAALVEALAREGVAVDDLRTQQSSLEDIFVGLLKGSEDAAPGAPEAATAVAARAEAAS